MTKGTGLLDFVLPPSLERGRPREQRDDVRLMVGSVTSQIVVDARFGDLPEFLNPGDVLVVNTSATLPAAIDARTTSGDEVVIHFSSRLPSQLWTVEVRHPDGLGSLPFPDFSGGVLRLDGGSTIEALDHHPGTARLWLTKVDEVGDVVDYLHRFGRPIRYGYAQDRWPLAAYQTVYARQPGSAEMPSAGRPFTAELITRLIAGGVAVLPLVLHAGVASLEEGEHPAEEFFSVPAPTALAVNAFRNAGGRVIAVGTTVVRALETVADPRGQLRAGEGYTDLIIEGNTTPRVIDGMLTGWHEPKASHLEMVGAVAGHELMTTMYQRAVELGYAWHEFGDSCLILP